jgi:hypothetical protein
MGNMPFHLEKGVLGLRMDNLMRIPDVRDHVLERLYDDEDPWYVATTISVGGQKINVLTDTKAAFAASLDVLDPGLAITGLAASVTLGADYLAKQALLRKLNVDTRGNRDGFMVFWNTKKNQVLVDQMRQELIIALQSGREVDFWWECSLPEGSAPQVKTLMDLPQVARVLFRTDHGPVTPEAPNQTPRLPLD